MTELPVGPASHLARRYGRPVAKGPRPYPQPETGAPTGDVLLAALRALVHAADTASVRQVVATAVGDLGGAIVPARFEPEHALPVDVSLGLAEPAVVVVDPLSLSALALREALPALLEDARVVLARLPEQANAGRYGDGTAEPDDLQRYLALLETGDTAGARTLTLDLLRRGVAPASLVEQVLAPAQREVGELWYRGTWSVADEHAATATTEACLALLPLPTEGPHVVVAAPEGEWHSLPGRMAAAASTGVQVRVLGPGLPADHLERYLEQQEPDLLALSCSMATNLIAAARSIAVAHEIGVPVVVGGRAFTIARGHRLGADGWSASLRLDGPLPVPREPVAALPHEAVVADAVADEVLLLALERQAAAGPWVRAMNEVQVRRSVEDLRWITRHAAAAHACDDASVLHDLLGWLDVLLRDRGVPAHVLPDGAEYLADALEAQTPAVADLVRGGAARLR